MSGRKQRGWQYAGTAGERSTISRSDRASLASLQVQRSPARSGRVVGRSKVRRPEELKGARSSSQRLSVRDVLIWTAVAVVAGAFLGLLARQTWVLALATAILIGAYVWRMLR